MDKQTILKSLHNQIIDLERMIRFFAQADHLSQIDIDLFKSKIRILYDQTEHLETLKIQSTAVDKIEKEVSSGKKHVDVPEPEPVTIPSPPEIPTPKPEKPTVVPPPQPQPQPIPEPSPSPTPPTPPHPTPTPVPTPAPSPTPEPSPSPAPRPGMEDMETAQANAWPSFTLTSQNTTDKNLIKKTPLGENARFQKEAVNEIYGKAKPAPKSTSNTQPVSDILVAIGLNDRFLFTRELFNNDSVLFRSTINQLNNLGGYDEAIDHLKKSFSWDAEDLVADQFLQIVKRRYL